MILYVYNLFVVQGADSLTASIFVDLDGAKHPYPISMHDDACEGTGLSCPLSAGETYTYVEQISVPRYIKVQYEYAYQTQGILMKC